MKLILHTCPCWHDGRGGEYKHTVATAEVYYRNCVFRNVNFGVLLKDYNSYDYAIDGCHFEDNQIGVYSPHGNFGLRNSRLLRSNVTDVYMGSIASTIHRVVSVNSTMFAIVGGWTNAPSTSFIHDSHVIGWRGSGGGGWWEQFGTSLPAVALAFRGPLSVVDTTFIPVDPQRAKLPPAVAAWTPQLSSNVSGHQDIYDPFNNTVFWSRSFVLGGLNYSGPHISALPSDQVLTLNGESPSDFASPALRAPIDADTNFVRSWWPTESKVFDLRQDFLGGNFTPNANCGRLTANNNYTAKHNFTAAIQACVDAAGEAGNGAVCYIPPGDYPVYSTIVLRGSNFSVEGAGGFQTTLVKCPCVYETGEGCGAQADRDGKSMINGSLFAVDAKHAMDVTVRQFQLQGEGTGTTLIHMCRSLGGGKLERVLRLEWLVARQAKTMQKCKETDIPDTPWSNHGKWQPAQTTCGAPTCSTQAGCNTKQFPSILEGFVFEDLGPNDTVLSTAVESLVYWKDSSAAIYLQMFGGQGLIIEAPKASQLASKATACRLAQLSAQSHLDAARCRNVIEQFDEAAISSLGFFGELFKFNSQNTFDLTVRDGQTWVAGYSYTETSARVTQLGPGTGLNQHGGLVTQPGPKFSAFCPDAVHANGWVGKYSLFSAPTGAQSGSSFLVGGTGLAESSTLLFMGMSFGYAPPLGLDRDGLHAIGNIVQSPNPNATAWCARQKGVVPSNPFGTCVAKDGNDVIGATTQARLAYDHVLVLGQWDLHLNYPHLLPANWKPPPASSRIPLKTDETSAGLSSTRTLLGLKENDKRSVRTACLDGHDNDGDGLVDWPLDPGCSNERDDNEGDDPPPTLSYLFNETDGRLLELNWTTAPGGPKRIVWDETYRFINPTLPRKVKDGGTAVWMHSAAGNLMGGGMHWKTHVDPNSNWNNVTDEVVTAPRLTTPVSINTTSHTITVSTESSEILVSDRFHFSGDTMFVTMNLTRKRDTEVVTSLPVNLGGMQLGNLYANGSLNVNKNKMWQLVADYGGWNNTWHGRCRDSKYDDGMCAISTPTPATYPRGAFSPVDVMADANVAISMMYLSEISAGNQVSFKQMIPFSRYLAGFRGGMQLTLSNKSTSLTVAFKVATAADWQSTLEPYKQFFDKTYGGVSYCPTGPFLVNAYEAGRVGGGGKNRLPKMSLYNISTPHSTAGKMRSYGTNLFGVWGTALYSSWETNSGQANEFNPVTEFLDPNIAEHDDAVMAKFLGEFTAGGIDVFW
jgi:hypothetical protein